MKRTLPKYILFLWIILLSASGQLSAHAQKVNTDYDPITDLRELVDISVYAQPIVHRYNFTQGSTDNDRIFFGFREAEIEEDDSKDQEDSSDDNDGCTSLFSKWHYYTTSQALPFQKHSSYLLHSKLFIVFCAYII